MQRGGGVGSGESLDMDKIVVKYEKFE